MDFNLFWTVIGSAVGVIGFIYTFLRNFKIDMNEKFAKIDQRFDKIDQRFDKIEEKITDIDRRLCRLEGAFSSKDCCRLSDERNFKKAE